MIKENFLGDNIARDDKLSAGLIYSQFASDDVLTEELRAMGAKQTGPLPVQSLARAISPSPSVVDDEVLKECRALSPAAIIEVVTFIGLLQLLHRLSSYFPAKV